MTIIGSPEELVEFVTRLLAVEFVGEDEDQDDETDLDPYDEDLGY